MELYGTALQHSSKHLKDLPSVLDDIFSLKFFAGIADYADVLLHSLEIKQLFTNDSTEIVAFAENSNRRVLKKRNLTESDTKTVHYSERIF